VYNAVTLGRGQVHSESGSIALLHTSWSSSTEDHSEDDLTMACEGSVTVDSINPSSTQVQKDDMYVSRAAFVPMSEPDLYGQRHPIESDALIRSKLVDFDFEVKQLDRHCALLNTTALDMAHENCPHLLTESFKLWFLRCEVFDVPKAAVRYARFWQKRVQVFGPTRAFARLTLESLTQEELEPL
jgi:hypothetical protein